MPPTTPNPASSSSDGSIVPGAQHVPVTPDITSAPVSDIAVPHKPEVVVESTPSASELTATTPEVTPSPAPEVVPPSETAEVVAGSVTAEEDALLAELLAGTPTASNTSDAPTPPVLEVEHVPVAPQAVPEKTLEEEEADIEIQSSAVLAKRKVVEADADKAFQERKTLEEDLAPMLLDEKLLIEQIDALDKKKAHAGKDEMRTLEEERWKLEDARRALEERKWPIAEKLETVTGTIKAGESAFKSLLAEEAQLDTKKKQLAIAKEERNLHAELEVITKEREATEEELAKFTAEKTRLADALRETKATDESALKEEHVVDAKADTARTLYEERVLAESRRKLEEERRSAEKRRWEAEDALPGVTRSVEETEAHLASIKKEEADILAKLDALGHA
jgi:hypothetical protein